jgi:phage gpG-like protein
MTAKDYGPVEIDLAGVPDKLEWLAHLGVDQTGPLSAIGDAWLARVQLGFDAGIDPWGTPWWPLSPNYRVGQPLRNEGHLMRSFDFIVTQDNELILGTNYGQLAGGGSIAAVHQFGTSDAGRSRNVNIPARPMLPVLPGESLPPDWGEEAIDILADAIDEAIRSPGRPPGAPPA